MIFDLSSPKLFPYFSRRNLPEYDRKTLIPKKMLGNLESLGGATEPV
jgi:hypothetical protein